METQTKRQITIIVPDLAKEEIYQSKTLEMFLKHYNIKSKTFSEKEFIGSKEGTNNTLCIFLGTGKRYNFSSYKNLLVESNEFAAEALSIGYNSNNAWISPVRFLSKEPGWVWDAKRFGVEYDKLCKDLGEITKNIRSSDDFDMNSDGKNNLFKFAFVYNPTAQIGFLYECVKYSIKEKKFNIKEIKEAEKILASDKFLPVKYVYIYGMMWFVKNCLSDFLKSNGLSLEQESKEVSSNDKNKPADFGSQAERFHAETERLNAELTSSGKKKTNQ